MSDYRPDCFDDILDGCAEFGTLLSAVSKNRLPAGILGLPPVPKAMVVSSLCSRTGRQALIVTPSEAEASRLADDLNFFGRKAELYPAKEWNFHSDENRSRDYERVRIGVLSHILSGETDTAVCSAEAALQFTIPPDILRGKTMRIATGTVITTTELAAAFEGAGYVRADTVDGKGLYSIRGDIADFFPPSEDEPIRIEFWGNSVDSVTRYDSQTQRRLDIIGSALIVPSLEVIPGDPPALSEKIRALAASLRGKNSAAAKEKLTQDSDLLSSSVRIPNADKYLPLIYERPGAIFDYFSDPLLIVSESSAVKTACERSGQLWQEELRALFEEGVLCKGLSEYSMDFTDLCGEYSSMDTVYADNFERGSFDTPVKELVSFSVMQTSGWDGSYRTLTDDISPELSRGFTEVVIAGTQKMCEGLAEEFAADKVRCSVHAHRPKKLISGCVNIIPGYLSSGIVFPLQKTGIVSYSRNAGGRRADSLLSDKKRAPKKKREDAFNSLDELHKGDYIVHNAHGIGIFDGIVSLTVQGTEKDYLKIDYAGGDTLYVPVTQLDLVSKYIGPQEENGHRTVKINKLDSAEWAHTKARVRAAVKDMADELIKLYAERARAEGFAFSPDIDMQNDFERRFEFDETDDQLRCTAEIKADMEEPHPMDRLLCGDVGFGKTEVALRAAFKCVADGKQVALLVPTTILALQHYRTMLSRFEGFPVNIDMLSRFRSPTETKEIIKKIRSGAIDIVTGTHRLISKDVVFKDLGLVIIDEEQRFGVAQKERFKNALPGVDILTLSATPIPRTLNFAMSGLRDMSVLEEAPLDRFPVQTYVLEFDMGILGEAIAKELRRGGQVYWLHNNVSDIMETAGRIKERFPDASVAVGHGQMPEEELSDVWRKMIGGETDILVCTTIIETGVDVPNVNTLIIENADRMGLSQLHQIRGRVGRSSRRASAYLTFQKGKQLSEISERRLAAIREFTEFGSGFRIAMRDLEIRGAGDLLGAQQHGHMAAVGYDMYLKLLAEAVQAQGSAGGSPAAAPESDCPVDVKIDAHIPEKYISSLPQRLQMYRRISEIRSEADASDVLDEFIDRFGEPPASVTGLIRIARIRGMAKSLGILEIKQTEFKLLIFTKDEDRRMISALAGRLRGRIMFSAGTKQYYTVRIMTGQTPADALEEFLGAYEAIKAAAGPAAADQI